MPIFTIQGGSETVLALDSVLGESEELIGVTLAALNNVARANTRSKRITVSLNEESKTKENDENGADDEEEVKQMLMPGKYSVFLLVKDTADSRITRKEVLVEILEPPVDDNAEQDEGNDQGEDGTGEATVVEPEIPEAGSSTVAETGRYEIPPEAEERAAKLTPEELKAILER